eukprot:scaffold39514_cov27-Prasinocladus_malaysianus.AAC.4
MPQGRAPAFVLSVLSIAFAQRVTLRLFVTEFLLHSILIPAIIHDLDLSLSVFRAAAPGCHHRSPVRHRRLHLELLRMHVPIVIGVITCPSSSDRLNATCGYTCGHISGARHFPAGRPGRGG